MAYATYSDIEKGFRELDDDSRKKADELIRRASIIVDSVAADDVSDEVKGIVVCNMVTRVLAVNEGGTDIPIGVTQGTQTGLGYTSSYTFGTGTSGELYLSRMDKRLLKCGNRIGSHSPIEEES